MTQKELLYVEDAIMHEKAIIEICNDAVNKLTGDSFKVFFNEQITEHKSMLDKLFSLLKEAINE